MPAEDESRLTESDAALLRKTAGGDRDALEVFVSRHEAAVFRLARALVGDSSRADDVLQETFLAAWRNAGQFDGGPSARGWLLTITRNAVHRQFRRHAGEPAEIGSLSDLGERAGWAVEDPRFAERLENRELVMAGFGTLTAEEREVLVLRDVEGFSGEEVARMLGLSVPAMKSRLHRARLRFMANVREKSHA